MYEDKTLVCKDCGNEFVFTAGEQEFYASRSAARPAVTPARTPAVAPARCSPLCVPPAVRKPACPSSPAKTVLCTAATALRR